MTIKPLGDRIFVKRIDQPTESAGGILLPDSTQEKPMEGIVIATGTGTFDKQGNRETFSVKEGDRVVFGKWSGEDVEVDGKEYVIITEDNIVGILR